MKKNFIAIISAISLLPLTGCSIAQNMDMNRLAESGSKMAQSLTVTNSQMQQYVKSYIAQTDAKNVVCGPNDPYTIRLGKILSGITSVEGTLSTSRSIAQMISMLSHAQTDLSAYTQD